MQALNLPAKFVGRMREMEQLRLVLDRAEAGNGDIVFIAGESGVGKTRLVEEMIEYANGRNFSVLQGQCVPDSLSSLVPFVDMLGRAGLAHIITEDRPPRIESAYVVDKEGNPLAKVERTEVRESAVFFGLVNTLKGFIIESLVNMTGTDQPEEINTIRYGDYNIANVPGNAVNVVVVTTGRENEYLIADVREALRVIERARVDEPFYEATLRNCLFGGKYEGLDYSFGDAKAKQASSFENVLKGLQRKAEARPLLLFVDDLQWADTASLELLYYLARNARSDRIAIVGTYRPEDVREGHKLDHLLKKVAKEGLGTLLHLRRFDEEECEKLVAYIVGKDEIELSKRLFEESEGNALFVIELLKNLADEGMLEHSVESMKLPSKIRDVISQRLERLRRDEREVLESASIIGEEFGAMLLAKLVGMSEFDIFSTLECIEKKAGIIKARMRTSEGVRYKFEHSKIREVLYEEQNEELRRACHETIASELECKLANGHAELLPDVVGHYLRAGVKEKVVEHGLDAGKYLRGRYSNEEAVSILESTLDALAETGDKRDMELATFDELAGALESEGKYDRALAYVDKKLSRLSSPVESNAAYRRRAEILIKKGSLDEALATIERGISALDACTDDESNLERAKSNYTKGFALERKGEYAKASEHQKEALVHLKMLGKENDVANVLNRLGVINMRLGNYDDALRYIAESEEMHLRLGNLRSAVLVQGNIGLVNWARGEYDKALEQFMKSLAGCEKVRDTRGLAVIYVNISSIHQEKGEYANAIENYRKAMKICGSTGDRTLMAYCLLGLAECFLEEGNKEECRHNLDASVGITRELNSREIDVVSMRVSGKLHVANGMREKGADELRRALEMLDKIGKRDIEYYKTLFEYGKAADKNAIMEALSYFEKMGISIWAKRAMDALHD